jgi:hypothetical protein
MGAIAEVILGAVSNRYVLSLLLVGLYALQYLQTRHIDVRIDGQGERLSVVEERVARLEDHLIEPAMTDGGHGVEERGSDD